MFQRLILAAVLVISFDVNAKLIKFDCSNPENHTLKMTIDESFINGGSTSPESADLDFVFDGEKYKWMNTQYLSFEILPQYVTTLFKHNALEKLYIEHSLVAEEASLSLSIDRKSFDFNCIKSL